MLFAYCPCHCLAAPGRATAPRQRASVSASAPDGSHLLVAVMRAREKRRQGTKDPMGHQNKTVSGRAHTCHAACPCVWWKELKMTDWGSNSALWWGFSFGLSTLLWGCVAVGGGVFPPCVFLQLCVCGPQSDRLVMAKKEGHLGIAGVSQRVSHHLRYFPSGLRLVVDNSGTSPWPGRCRSRWGWVADLWNQGCR